MKMRTGTVSTTIVGASARDRHEAPPCLVVAFLELASRRLYPFPAGGHHFFVGRDPSRSEMVLRHHRELSGEHALIQRELDKVFLADCGSRNGTRIHGHPEQRGTLRPGDVFALAGYKFVAMSQAMIAQLDELTLYVGRSEHLPELLTLRQDQHVVLLGPHHAPLEQIARAAHRAVASPASPMVCIQARHRSHSEERVLADAINGRIFIDGRGTAKRRAAPEFTADELQRLRHPQQLTAVTLGLVTVDDVDDLFVEHKPFYLKVPSLKERIKKQGLDELIDAICIRWDVPTRATDWPPVLRARLSRYAWNRDHKQFTAVIVAVGRMWCGLDEHSAVTGLGAAQTVKDWLTELNLGRDSAWAMRPR